MGIEPFTVVVGKMNCAANTGLLNKALKAAIDIGLPRAMRALALTAVAGQLSGAEKVEVLEEAIDATRYIISIGSREEALAAVAR